ncbi:MAG: YabP/YqfC family sporulation protein [Oscillospiraceae bacterium]|nr:YabP/YqfC family sporulation protein [Oscillospiraceae bacterium]
MSLRDRIIGLEELAARDCTITVQIHGGREREMYIENCRKIISCDDDFITLGIVGAQIRVSGVPLILENFGVGGVKISGKISAVEFEEIPVNDDEK